MKIKIKNCRTIKYERPIFKLLTVTMGLYRKNTQVKKGTENQQATCKFTCDERKFPGGEENDAPCNQNRKRQE